MKKIIALCMMIIALGFVTTGCGGSSPAPAPAPPVNAGDGHAGHDHGADQSTSVQDEE